MAMTKIQKGLAVLGISVLLLGIGGKAALASGAGQSFWNDVKYLVAQQLAGQVEVPAAFVEAALGSAQTVALHATAESVSNLGGLFLWDTDTTSGLEVKGPTWLQTLNVSSTVTISGTTTLGYTLNQLNTPQVAFNSNSTTVCSVQNTSGADRVIPSFSMGFTGSSGSGGLTQFRAYVSAGRADMNTAATATLFKQAFIAVAATMKNVYGGPVPGSYYVTSSLVYDTAVGTPTTTPVIWPNGWYANVTSTAIASSTGNCMVASYPL